MPVWEADHVTQFVLDEMYPHQKVIAGLTPDDEVLIRTMLDQNVATVGPGRKIQTFYPVVFDDGRLKATARFGTNSSPVPIHLIRFHSSEKGQRHAGFLGDEYPRLKFRGDAVRREWFLIERM